MVTVVLFDTLVIPAERLREYAVVPRLNSSHQGRNHAVTATHKSATSSTNASPSTKTADYGPIVLSCRFVGSKQLNTSVTVVFHQREVGLFEPNRPLGPRSVWTRDLPKFSAVLRALVWERIESEPRGHPLSRPPSTLFCADSTSNTPTWTTSWIPSPEREGNSRND